MTALDIEPSSMWLTLMASASKVHTEWPSLLHTILFAVGCIFFLLLNAFFVASEFAIMKIRSSQIETIKDKYPRRSAIARKMKEDLDGYLSANQLGITIASLALGLLAEPYIDRLLKTLMLVKFDQWWNWDLSSFTNVWGFDLISFLSYTLALAFFTILHVVIGELVPKSYAIRKPVETTMAIASPLTTFYAIFHGLIDILNRMAGVILKTFFKLDIITETEHDVHSSKELALLVEESEKGDEVTQTERKILINALELNDIHVKDVMTPRSDVISLDVDLPFGQNLILATKSKHTRFPLVQGHFDNTLGLIHIKDLLLLVKEDSPNLSAIKRPIKIVSETMPLDGLLQFFLTEKVHLAMVVDEFGDTSGLVFLDNVMEELVGDIQDEFDNEVSAFNRVNQNEFFVEGSLPLNELSDYVPELVLERSDISTVGGYITQQIGKIPKPGETTLIENYEATVTNTDGRRVCQAHFRKVQIEVKPAIEEVA